jgi:hypothetical protein
VLQLDSWSSYPAACMLSSTTARAPAPGAAHPAPDASSTLRSIFNDAVELFAREKAANADADKRKEDREVSHLAAQWAQSRWAAVAAITAGLSLVVGTVTLYFLWRTLRETRRTAAAAVAAAQAAQASVKVMEDNAARELRAYPGIIGAGIDILGEACNVWVSVKNHSTTPAYHFRQAIQFELCPRDAIKPFSASPLRDMQWDMVPGSESTLRASRNLNSDEVNDLTKLETQVVVISGRVECRDIFGTQRHIEFQYRSGAFTRTYAAIDNRYNFLCHEPEPIHYRSD